MSLASSAQANPTYSISELAGEFDISTRTIRFYEEKGLISPERTSGGQRIYTRRDRARLSSYFEASAWATAWRR